MTRRTRRADQPIRVTCEWVPTPEQAAAMFRESIPALARLIRAYREQQEAADGDGGSGVVVAGSGRDRSSRHLVPDAARPAA